MKFAHMGDCHLGGWRQPELKDLNFKSFQMAIDRIIKEKVDFVLITGDLFDSSYPPIETLKDSFKEFRRLKEEKIPVFIIAGSHDYSVSGKTFLDVLEKSGFCQNVAVFQERNGSIILEPTIYQNVAIYGYPGKKSGLEVDDIQRIKIQDSPGLFKILMLHTTISDAVRGLPIKCVDEKKLPKVDYLALGHLHIDYNKEGRVYSGPIFPNNLSELTELKAGSFYIFDNGKIRKEQIKIKDICFIEMEIKDALTGTQKILERLEKEDVRDKIVILKLYGIIERGKNSDIDFAGIDQILKKRGAFLTLKSTSKLHMAETEIKIDFQESINLEEQIIKKFEETNPNKNNSLIFSLIKSLQMEKQDDEKSANFEERVITESKRLLNL